MINANELRIGNWVSLYNDTPVRVSVIGKQVLQIEEGSGNVFPLQNVEPIPLTPEILVKAGFEKYGDGEHNEMEMVGYRHGKFDIYYTEKNTFHFADNRTEMELCEIFYLHQLQNVFYFLSSSELDINF